MWLYKGRTTGEVFLNISNNGSRFFWNGNLTITGNRYIHGKKRFTVKNLDG